MEICSCLIEREKKTERTILWYCLPLRRFSFADTAEAFPRLNEPRASCRHVDRADRRKSAGEKTRERKKRAKEPCSELPCATKNTPAMEYRLTTARSAGYFVLSWKSNVHRCARCVLGTGVHEYQAAVLLSDNETDI